MEKSATRARVGFTSKGPSAREGADIFNQEGEKVQPDLYLDSCPIEPSLIANATTLCHHKLSVAFLLYGGQGSF